MSKRSGRRQQRPGHVPQPVLEQRPADRLQSAEDVPCPTCGTEDGGEFGPCVDCHTTYGTCYGATYDDDDELVEHPVVSWTGDGRVTLGRTCPACSPAA